MAIFIGPERRSPLQDALGTFNQGLSGSLQALAQSKLQEIQQQRDTEKNFQALSSLLGPEQAKALAPLKSDVLKPILSDYFKNQRIAQESAALDKYLSGFMESGQQPMIPGQQLSPGQEVQPQQSQIPLNPLDLYKVAPTLAPKIVPALQGQQNLAETKTHHREIEKQGQQRLDLTAAQIEEQKKKTAIDTNAKFVEEQNKILDTAPSAIRNYDRLIGTFKNKPHELLAGPEKIAAEALGVDWLFGNPTQDIAQQGINKLVQDSAQLYRGLGSYSDRDALNTQKAMGNLYNTPRGAQAIFEASKAQKEGEYAFAQEVEKVRKANGGWLPIGGDIIARQNAQPALRAAAEKEKNAFRRLGVYYPDDIPKKYMSDVSQMPIGKQFTVPETGTRFKKTENGTEVVSYAY